MVSTGSISAWTEFTHSGSVEALILEKKLVIFEFELKLRQLLSLSHPLWAFVIPYVFAFLLWEQLVDLSGLPLSLKVDLVIVLLLVI